jgi:endonuclease/exonuclease/phosphatase family metal-dependent hydrolase
MFLGWMGWISVLLAQWAVTVSPDVTALPALAGLTFPIGAPLLLFGSFTALRRRRWKAAMAMWALVLWSAPLFQATWGCAGCGMEASEGSEFKVVSWNVRLFDYYGWLGGDGEAGRNEVRREIIATVGAAAPDVLCLQEYFELTDKAAFPVVQPLNLAMGNGAPAFSHVVIARSKSDRKFGVATWSRWPIVGRSAIEFGTRNNNVCAVTDVAWEGDTVRIFNAHFSSLRFEQEDYAALEEGMPDAEGRGRIWGRMSAAYVERVEQVSRVMEAVEASPHPVVLCGDFNDTPTSWALARCRKSLRDSHDARFLTLDGTWQGALPGVRIDHVLAGEDWSVKSHGTGGEGLSDHRYVSVGLGAVRP